MYSPRSTASQGGISRFLEGHRQQPWMARHSSTGLPELHLYRYRNWREGEYPQDEYWSSGSKHAQLLRGECVHAFDHSNGSILHWVVSKESTHPRRGAKTQKSCSRVRNGERLRRKVPTKSCRAREAYIDEMLKMTLATTAHHPTGVPL